MTTGAQIKEIIKNAIDEIPDTQYEILAIIHLCIVKTCNKFKLKLFQPKPE